MRIGVDASCWANPRGYGRFTRELLTAMMDLDSEHTYVLVADQATAETLPGDYPNVEVIVVPQSVPPTEAASADGNRSPTDMLRFTRAVHALQPDVFFFPSVYTFFPVPPGTRLVVTIHDAITERFPHLTLPNRRARLFWNAKVNLAIRQSDLVLTVSDYAARDLQTILGVSPGRLRVSGEAPAGTYAPVTDPRAVRASAESVGIPPDAPWFVYVGGFNPHKRLDVLLAAHAAVASESENPPHLVLVGPGDQDVFHGEQDFDHFVAHHGIAHLVHRPGFLEDETLAALHSGCVALVLPSECEGYGLPAVEAAACGAAVIATVESPLPDVLRGGGFWIQPGDQAGLETAMHRLLDDPSGRAALGSRALERARQLTWDAAARSALNTLVEAAA